MMYAMDDLEWTEAELLAADAHASALVGWKDEPNEAEAAARVMRGEWDEETSHFDVRPSFERIRDERNQYAEAVRSYLASTRDETIHTRLVWDGSESSGRFVAQYHAPLETLRSGRTGKWRARHYTDVGDADGNPLWFDTADEAKRAAIGSYETRLVESVDAWTRAFGRPPRSKP